MKTLEPHVTTVSDYASRATYSGSGVSLLASFGGIDWMAWLGAAVAVAGLLINLFFKLREDKRQAEKHELEKKRLHCSMTKGKCDEQ